MECEFEEKQYEQLLNIELAWRGSVYPAGQVLENIIGIDAAVFTKDPGFWRLWNLRRWWWPFGSAWKKGVALSPGHWKHAQHELDSASFPRFKCNVFIQYKRPEFITSPRGKEYGYWRQRYFRYDTRSQQQDILYELEQRISKNSLVVYACPAFFKLKELWHFDKIKKRL